VSGSARILVVDDDPRICRLVARYLSQEGYQVRMACSGEEMRRSIQAEEPDLILLDLMLPDEDGFSLARELRAKPHIAIVILTAKAATVDKVAGLELGADDYITKPFDERELLARVRSVLRRTSPKATKAPAASGSLARFAGWTLDLKGYELIAPWGEQVHLTTHEFQLLSAFVERSDRVLTREAILELISGRDWSPFDRSVDVLVGKLRKKLQDDPDDPRLIKTVRGAGYKLTAKVELA